jgi:uncharacterized protein YjbI with pentapeptide repeats
MTDHGTDSESRPRSWLPWAFLVVLVVVAGIGVALLPGVDWLTLGLEPDHRSDLASALIGGAIIGVVVLGAEHAFARRLQSIEEQREARAAKEALQLQLGLGASFPGIDLPGRDLSGFYLVEKDFVKANLARVDLSGATLSQANLTRADLGGANLEKATLWGANLEWAILSGASLKGAVLNRANAEGANFSVADLTRADLRRANLIHANLDHANLTGARLMRADLSGATLRGVKISWTFFDGANISGADFSDPGVLFFASVKREPVQPMWGGVIWDPERPPIWPTRDDFEPPPNAWPGEPWSDFADLI